MMNEYRKRLPHPMLSIPHMIVVFIVVLVVFGPHKLPELARGLGKLMAEFRKASTDFKSAFEQEMRDIERQTMLAERKKAADAAAASAAAATQQSPAAPATLATPAGTDTRLAEGAFGPATEGGGATDSSAPNDTRATEALVVTPVAEGVARGTEENALATSNNGVSHVAEPENTIGDPHRIAAPQEGSTVAAVAANNPAHDTQQPA
jgi:sec-independent protein translocase protein TatB